jgi:galactose mutarotase-like enzyme
MSSTSCVEIRDQTGALAQVLPELGGWLVRYQRPIPGHGLVDGVHHNEAVIARYPREMWAGSPLLFPMVSYNHVPGADHHYPWAGKTHPMQPHGFARKTPWKVTNQAADRVELELTDSETTRAVYPFAFRYGLTYRLEDGRLHWEQLIENRSSEPMPFSAGFHPYLPIPLGPGSKRSDCVIRCPRATRFNPIGRGEAYFSEPFPEQEFPATVDTGPALLLGDLRNREVALVDQAARLEVVIHWDDAPAYRFCGLWSRTPSENFYCLEPWTSLPNAFSRPDDGELQVLQPGDVFRAAMWMEVRAC